MKRIVLAADNADVRDDIARLMSGRWTLETVSDGLAALAAIRRNPPDLVLSELMMPGLDGVGLLRELRVDPKTRTVPVILLSAREGDESTIDGLDAGADDYLFKPFSARELVARVQAQLTIATLRKEANALQERFLAVVSHDLRNPLSTIDLGIGILRMRASDDKTTRTLARMSTNSLRMSRMIDQILDLTRSRLGGGLVVKVASTDLSALLQRIVDDLRISERAITLRCPSSIPGMWDPGRLEQVFSNLVGNALHHGLASAPVTVEAREEGPCVQIDVHNDGPPIPEDLQRKMFDPFWRNLGDSRGEKTAGLGLGLFISRELILAHGGEIDVRSNSAEGTTFRVTLPLTTSNPPFTVAQADRV